MARIARRSLRIRELPLFSLPKPWNALVDGSGDLPLQMFEPRYVELARRIEPPVGSAQFGYAQVSERRRGGVGMLAAARTFRWMGPNSRGPVLLIAKGKQAFRILSVRAEEVKDGDPLYIAHVQLLAPRDLARVTSAPTTIFGQVFIQQGAYGFASYHFGVDESYISYESTMCTTFPPLDDGSRPPQRKVFKGASFDAATRTFRGTIDWAPTTWHGAARWEYEMVFAADFSRIVGGQVRWFGPGDTDADAAKMSVFAKDLHYRLWQEEKDDPTNVIRNALLDAGVPAQEVDKAIEKAKDSE